MMSSRRVRWMVVVVVGSGLLAGAAYGEDPWADAVAEWSNPSPWPGFDEPSVALGEPAAESMFYPYTSSIVSLTVPASYLTLKFNTPVTDDPANAMGLDCIVYGNAFWTGANPQLKWQEPALVLISEDVNGNGLADDPWYMIPGSRGFAPIPSVSEPTGDDNEPPLPADLLAGRIRNPNSTDGDSTNDDEEYNWGYGDMSPAVAQYLDNHVRPDDPLEVGLTSRSGGGDAFDIADAVRIDGTGNPGGISQFHFIKLLAFVDRSFQSLGSCSPEIDAVADVAPEIDVDGDGILDEYETRVAGTDPARPESTVLPLEIPAIEGGSPYGTLLGAAGDSRGTKLRLYAADPRTDDGRNHNCIVDILEPAEPGGTLPSPGLLKSGTIREVQSSESDFQQARIQHAEVVIQYLPAEVAGLHEAGLEPYRYQDGAYTQAGISDIQLNAAANLVTFRTRYPGTFLLASAAGTGDTAISAPTGSITLTPWPASPSVADPANLISVTSSVVQSFGGGPVPDGTLITVATTRGSIAAVDVDGGTPGVQVTTVGGVIGFDVEPPTLVGTTLISATSVEGSAYGETAHQFVAGPPVGPVSWVLGEPEGTGPVTVQLTSSVITDQYGNTVADGTLLTLVVVDGTITSADADSSLTGHQVTVESGRATVYVSVPTESDRFTLRTYGDDLLISQLGHGEYGPEDYVPMPGPGAALVVGGVLAAALLSLWKKRK